MSDRQLRVGLVTEPEGIDDPYNRGAYDCTCNAAEESVTIVDANFLAAFGPRGCNVARVSFTGSGYLAYTRVEVTRPSGVEALCVYDHLNGGACGTRNFCDAYNTSPAASYQNALPDFDSDGVPDCNDPDADNVLFDTLRSSLAPAIRVVEVDAHINDPAFADVVSAELLAMLATR